MGVNNDVRIFVFELQRRRLAGEQFLYKLLEKEGTLRHRVGSRERQLTVILGEHGIAGRFQEEDGGIVRVLVEQIQVMKPHGSSHLQAPLTERRSPTALAAKWKRHLETSSFEDSYGSRPNVGLMVPHEGIIPKHNSGCLHKVLIGQVCHIARAG